MNINKFLNDEMSFENLRENPHLYKNTVCCLLFLSPKFLCSL